MWKNVALSTIHGQVRAIVIGGDPAAIEERIRFVALVLAAGQRLASGNATLFVAARDALDRDGGRRRRQDDAPKTQ